MKRLFDTKNPNLEGWWDTRITTGNGGCFIPASVLDNERYGPEVWLFFNGFNRWPNFTPNELRSKGNGDLRIHYETLDAMQQLRTWLKRPLVVSSYYRDPAYNAKVGGAENSYHLLGRAVDTPILATELGRLKLWYYASLAGFNGIGSYEGFTHLDTGPARQWIDRTPLRP